MKKAFNYVNERIMSWMYAAGMAFGLCLAGGECESLTGTFLCGVVGLASAALSGFLFAGELERMARRGIK